MHLFSHKYLTDIFWELNLCWCCSCPSSTETHLDSQKNAEEMNTGIQSWHLVPEVIGAENNEPGCCIRVYALFLHWWLWGCSTANVITLHGWTDMNQWAQEPQTQLALHGHSALVFSHQLRDTWHHSGLWAGPWGRNCPVWVLSFLVACTQN